MSASMNYLDGNEASNGHLDQLFDELSKNRETKTATREAQMIGQTLRRTQDAHLVVGQSGSLANEPGSKWSSV
jgi:hypothetical protein